MNKTPNFSRTSARDRERQLGLASQRGGGGEMEGVQRRRGLWKDLKHRMRFKGIGFCGSSWSIGASDMSPREDLLDEDDQVGEESIRNQTTTTTTTISDLLGQSRRPIPPCNTANAGMNLATALAAERSQRNAVQAVSATATTTTTGPPLISLMRLFEEMDGEDGGRKKREGVDGVCCVCIERSKGAAFIPCGHTFCRVCSRELWLNRGCCPLCNRSIVEILDIF